MLPESRQNEYLYPIPPFSIETKNVDDFIEELRLFHEQFYDGFERSEPLGNFFKYMVGQLSNLERKSTEPTAVNLSGTGSVRSMQKSLSDAVWYEDIILSHYHNMVNKEMGDPEGVLIFDESGFVKKGSDSIGVAGQYCGTIGKAENCQVGVFAGYASPKGCVITDKRIFIPEKRFEEEYEKKRKKCNLPEETGFKTKPELAAEMFREIKEAGRINFKYIVSDTVYGNSPGFIDAIESCIGKVYMVSMPNDTLFRLRTPVTEEKTYQYNGEQHSKKVLHKDEKQPVSFKDYAQNLNACFWYRRTVSEGTKGPITYEFAKRHVILAKDGLPWKNVWLIIKRTVGENPKYSYYISNALLSVRLNFFVWLSGVRRAIEQCFEENKTELGMDHYEVRKYTGWNRHMLTCMLSHFFLWHLKMKLGDKTPAITLPQLRLLLQSVLPLKKFSAQETIDLVRWIQIKNHNAYLSHRKKSLSG